MYYQMSHLEDHLNPLQSTASPQGIESYLPQGIVQEASSPNYLPASPLEGMASITYTTTSQGLTYNVTVSGPKSKLYATVMPFMQNYFLPDIANKPEESDLERALNTPQEQIIFSPSEFTTTPTPQVSELTQLEPFIKEAFEKTTKKSLPQNISIALCTEEELQQAHLFYGGNWSKGVQGFCINKKRGISNIFVKKGELAHVLLTIGHELGHLQSAPLNDIEEEAKAYAFSMAWMRVIREENIANLQNVLITDTPARNGLHNVAFDFVCNMLRKGKEALEVFDLLIKGERIETFI